MIVPLWLPRVKLIRNRIHILTIILLTMLKGILKWHQSTISQIPIIVLPWAQVSLIIYRIGLKQ
jgi:hypothetical protein